MKDTLQAIGNVKTEEDMMKFNEFEFDNPHKVCFSVFSATATCEQKVSEYTSPLKAFRVWNKKKTRCDHLPFVTVRTQNGLDMNISFDFTDLQSHTPYGRTLAYQEFLYRVAERIEYIEVYSPQDL